MNPQIDWLIQACGKDVSELTVKARGLLFRLGDVPRDFYLVVEGEARARRYGSDGAEIIMLRARAGDLFAEAGMVVPRYSCEGYCPVASRLMRIPLATVKARVAGGGDFALHFTQFLALSSRRQCARYERLRLKRAGDRVMHYFNCELASSEGGVLELDIPLTEWADDLGLEPETLYRTLADLEKKGMIIREPRGRKIRIVGTVAACAA